MSLPCTVTQDFFQVIFERNNQTQDIDESIDQIKSD